MWRAGLFAAGFALFFAGMRVLVRGLKNASGTKVQALLSRATKSSWAGILVGTLVTILVQSSGLVTSLTVGLVEAGACSLVQGIYITMGANLGTTIVPQILAVRLPPLEFVLLALAVVMKAFRRSNRALVLAGGGLLMLGMRLMIEGASPLAQAGLFRALLNSAARTPFTAIVFGAVASAALQSSGLIVAMTLALVKAEAIPAAIAVSVALGSNVGTCFTALLASLGTGRAARTVALFHLVYNIAGVALLYPFLDPFMGFLASISASSAGRVANAHTFFNAASILVFWPAVAILLGRPDNKPQMVPAYGKRGSLRP